ncbi:transmembrane protein 53-like [Limulus polyphemus]|uniref:Transmembrane protein 53-like n=1 Tax=Limulus polyphemus TaxID=6850 RepID=A0ABM1BS63_LIMPO|nr:transmembrane protein 53-like [Limulus polyphemus]
MDAYDFEFLVSFPSSVPSSNTLICKLNEKEPVVILFGWLGCADRYLTKYGNLYEKYGCITVRYTPPVQCVLNMSAQKLLYQHALKLIAFLEDIGLEKHPVFFHVFSNTGTMMYGIISDLLKKRKTVSFQVQGCIYDSAPAKLSFFGIAKSIISVTPGNIFYKYFISFFSTLFMYMYSCALSVWLGQKILDKQPYHYNRVWDNLIDEPGKHPQLFLFSKADDLCPYKTIEDFIQWRKKHGVDVTSVLWEDSKHVRHLEEHEEDYTSHIVNFLEHCLSHQREMCIEKKADEDD